MRTYSQATLRLSSTALFWTETQIKTETAISAMAAAMSTFTINAKAKKRINSQGDDYS